MAEIDSRDREEAVARINELTAGEGDNKQEHGTIPSAMEARHDLPKTSEELKELKLKHENEAREKNHL